MAQRPQKARKFLVFLRARRHALREATFQETLAQTASPEPGGTAPVEAGVWALATRLQAYGPVGARDAVELTVLEKRWQRGLDGLGVEPPPFSQGTLCNCRLRLRAHNVDKTLLERTVALADTPGGFGARQLRAALDSTPLCGAGRVEDTLHLLGQALRQAVGLAAQDLGPSAEAIVAEGGRVLVGPSRLKAALDLAWGERPARASARRAVLDAVERWKRWLEPPPSLWAQEPPRQERMDTRGQMVAPDTAPDPEGGPGARRIEPQVAPARRSSLEEKDMRHGRTSRAKTFNGFQEPCALDVDRTVTREVVVCPANAPEPEAVELLAETLEQGLGLLPLDIDLGSRASPRMAPWAAQGVPMIARPWPHVGDRCTNNAFTLDCLQGTVTCPQGERVPMIPGRDTPCPARACDACAVRAQCPTARLGQEEPAPPRGRAVPTHAAGQEQDEARTGLAAQTHGGGAGDLPSVSAPRTASPLEGAAQKPV